MRLNRKQKGTTLKLIDWWEGENLLTAEQSNRLKESLEIKTINWKKVAEYLMILAIISVVTAFLTLVADEWILELFERLFNLSDLAILILLLILSAGFVFGARKMPSRRKKQQISMQALLVMGSIAFGGALNYFGKISDLSGFGETFLILIFAVHAFVLSRFFKVILFSGIGWASVMLWLGIESSPDKNSESGRMGMNLALRYLFFSLIPLFAGMWIKRNQKLYAFARLTERTGWLFLWLALWGVALFGNHNTLDSWEEASSLSLLPWGILMGVLGVTVWFAGRKLDNKEWMWMGGLALIADAYTQFFLFLWEPLHPALFFTLLGGSFWLLGRRAEIIK